jgi:hypothetical protein
MRADEVRGELWSAQSSPAGADVEIDPKSGLISILG